jgi:hypothetical protein
MASIYTAKQAPIRGPYVKQAFAKSLYKGEDAWLQQRDVSVPASGGVSHCSSACKISQCEKFSSSCMQHICVAISGL